MFRSLFALCFLLACLGPAAAADPPPSSRIVFMIGEDEYKTWETLPEFAQSDLVPKGYRVTIIQADPADKNNFPGLVEALKDADLLFLSTRRRTPHKDQLAAVRAHLDAGKPLVGVRTACHAFALRPNDKLASTELEAWQDFDPVVLGGHYTNHHPPGPDTTITFASEAASHPILQGITVSELVGHGSLYKVNPLVADARPLLIGSIPNQPAESIAWTHEYGPKHARVFFTSLGHPEDFKESAFRRLLINAIAWALAK